MKKGFFSLLMMVILINPLFANSFTPAKTTMDIKVTQDNVPQGDIEDFFDRIKIACENPDEAGNQLPPENIMFICMRSTLLWGVTPSVKSVDLPNVCLLDAALFCDKDLGSMQEQWDISNSNECNPHAVTPQTAGDLPSAGDADIDVVECPRFYSFAFYELITKQGITCDEIEDVESVQEYCMELLAGDDTKVWSDPDGGTVDLCADRPDQGLPGIGFPPVVPEPAVCDGSVYPPAEECCDGAIQPVNGPLCEKACNSISAGDIENYPYCCDGTVPGSGVSIPGQPILPAVCASKPGPTPKFMSARK